MGLDFKAGFEAGRKFSSLELREGVLLQDLDRLKEPWNLADPAPVEAQLAVTQAEINTLQDQVEMRMAPERFESGGGI